MIFPSKIAEAYFAYVSAPAMRQREAYAEYVATFPAAEREAFFADWKARLPIDEAANKARRSAENEIRRQAGIKAGIARRKNISRS